MRKCYFKIGIILMSLTVTMQGSPALAAEDIPRADRKKTVRIVAVGDSLTEGVGDTTNQQGYTKRIARSLSKQFKTTKFKTANYGKAGDRSDQILQRVQLNTAAVKDIKRADVVLLTVGGNDLQQTLFSAIFAQSKSQINHKVAKSLPAYSNKLTKLVKYIRKKNAEASIFILGNYNPLYVYFANRTDLNIAVKQYNAVNLAKAALETNMYYVSTFKRLTYGQYQTTAARAKLVKVAKSANRGSVKNKLVEEALTEKDHEKNAYITTLDHYHPNDKGYDAMTKLLKIKMVAHQEGWLQK
ncbi:GDSL-type esterase/lipase family protein [Weissella soli]|uniref:GDSL-type esterase/lipase family protein n=1 Tax=Weissella soli TaxID=155866 RepID=UPI00359FF5AB